MKIEDIESKVLIHDYENHHIVFLQGDIGTSILNLDISSNNLYDVGVIALSMHEKSLPIFNFNPPATILISQNSGLEFIKVAAYERKQALDLMLKFSDIINMVPCSPKKELVREAGNLIPIQMLVNKDINYLSNAWNIDKKYAFLVDAYLSFVSLDEALSKEEMIKKLTEKFNLPRSLNYNIMFRRSIK
jgi:hypothetical protein